ncbi:MULTISPECIES: YqgE/AlgH family protein [unclassified Tenacibaculum]|uniref:YqgE/AlgH family protein n=1 Tax=unclassified Tenacibaculum TaxID=2635139 RepID=UPI001F25126C|nr:MULTISPECIES: YqgE/AlgH family protein [unclassified Tenacibaculum]MCF2873123.1 YqgE/AlgH family protein [Tenacibaculum sp. Cn5-1]MCF2933279.1 YqgE/AlgH family protein [Tenacibaculum sp. Cn5-34]MCG7510140.1 YqgE/AlgH family protein [Tenacibaculum sp. Cn5-46]
MVALKPERGRLLIAEPAILNDSSFKRAIILLTEHTESSSVGFILNRPLNYTLNDLVPEIDCDFTVYQGGPVEQDNLYFIHKVPHLIPNSIEVANGIFWGGNFELLKELLNNNLLEPTDIRFFLGYSGWGVNQLENELFSNSWFVSENDYRNILSTNNETFWKDQLLQKGGKYKIWANAPSDVQMN